MVGERVAGRIRFYRKGKGWSVEALSAECARRGAPQLTQAALWNIERRATTGRRQRPVAVEELLVLAEALGVPPLLLVAAPPSTRCRWCSNLPPAGFTCNACGRAVVAAEKG
jgi:transcriptional regulator with XRE-family HTH domain